MPGLAGDFLARSILVKQRKLYTQHSIRMSRSIFLTSFDVPHSKSKTLNLVEYELKSILLDEDTCKTHKNAHSKAHSFQE